jgi:hypothetical protein
MDLKQFVNETLTQIAQGVSEAQTSVRSVGGFVNPALRGVVNRESYFGSVETGQHVFLVEFDVAVTVAKGKGTNAGAKLEVASFLSLGAGGKSNEETQSTSRVKFKVPIALPVDPEAKRAMDQEIQQEKDEAAAAMARHSESDRI